MAGLRIEGSTSGNVVEVDASNNLKIAGAVTIADPLVLSNTTVGSVRNFSENDAGLGTGTPYLLSPETNSESQLKVTLENLLDDEVITYFNSSKFSTTNISTNALITGAGWNTDTTMVATNLGAYARFQAYKGVKLMGSEIISLDLSWTLSHTNATYNRLYMGLVVGGPANNEASDYVGFLFDAVGLTGVIRQGGTYISSVTLKGADGSPFVTTYGRQYNTTMYVNVREVTFWIQDPVLGLTWLAGRIVTPSGYASPLISSSDYKVMAHNFRTTTPPVTACNFILKRYTLRKGGIGALPSFNEQQARISEHAYQMGKVQAGMGPLTTSGSLTRNAALVPANNGSTRLNVLNGIVKENGTMALGVDGVLMHMNLYNPGNYSRLRIDGVSIASAVTTAFTAGGFSKFFYIAFAGYATGSNLNGLYGNGTDSPEGNGPGKAYRMVMLPFVQHYTATHQPGVTNEQNVTYHKFKNPIYCNYQEDIALATFNEGAAAGVGGIITHVVQFDYCWE